MNHDSLGRVLVSRRPNSSRATARWKHGLVNLNVTECYGLTDIQRILDRFAPRLLAARPTLRYDAPMSLRFPGVEFRIARQRVAPDHILIRSTLPESSVEVPETFDFDAPESTPRISNALCTIARKIAPEVLMPRVRELAEAVGRRPQGWAFSTGYRTLGTCSSRGIITLSSALVFLPQELRDYIVLHEIAHLSEMNHSPRFHAVLDGYLGGREAILVNRLKTYSWPVLR